MSDDNDFAARMRKRRGAPAPKPRPKKLRPGESVLVVEDELRAALGFAAHGSIPIRTESIEATGKTITFDPKTLSKLKP